MTAPPALLVGVFPAAEHGRRRALLAALEEAFPVRFESRQRGEMRGLDAVLELAGEGRGAEADALGLPALSMLRAEPPAGGQLLTNTLAREPQLDRRLRGAALPDAHLGAAPGAALEAPERATVLASGPSGPTWTRAGGRERSLLAPAELGAGEALRERLYRSRSAALLPLVHFLRELTAPIRWQAPRARASLLFDDPNLHWPSYGFVKLGALSEHARARGYHVALAMVPLDARFAHPAALRALQESCGAISLLVHGNDHNGGELGRLATESEAVALATQALRRVRAFERRTGAAVDRVMVPPHEECSEATPRALLRCGFEAISMTRPYPWLAQPPRTWLARPPGVGPLAGWAPADFADGLPVLLRHPIVDRDGPELVLRAFLDQPLILYGHHDDLREGLGVLGDAVDEVNRLQETRWCSLGEVAAASFETRLDGTRLAVRPLSRRIRLEVPDGATEIQVSDPPGSRLERPAPRLSVDGRPARFGEPVDVLPGATVVLEVRAGEEIDVRTAAAPRRRPLVVARRIVGESRDRLLPLVSRAR